MGAARGIAERVERALASAAELEQLGAVWELDGERARERARQLERRSERGEDTGPLTGTVCGWKDCFDVAGLHTTGGAPWRSSAAPVAASAVIVKRLEAAGAISIGKLAMTQLAWGMMGQTPGRPTCRNPHDRQRVPGGSSAGSAVAVSAGIVDHAPGTDAGGSVRHPAAACGVVGFKPTYGAVPLTGCLPYAPSFDTGGAIARTVAESALQHAVITSTPPADLGGGLAGLRIAFLGGYFTAALEDGVATMLERARGRVRAREIEIAWSQADNRSMAPVFTAEPGAFVLEHDPQPDPAEYDAGTFADVEEARTLPAIEYVRALGELAEARIRCAAAADGHDVLLCASAPCAPVVIDGPDKTTRMNALTKPFNALRWPALSLPAGFDVHGLPLGLQVVGLPGTDAVVLRAAAALERILQA